MTAPAWIGLIGTAVPTELIIGKGLILLTILSTDNVSNSTIKPTDIIATQPRNKLEETLV